VADRDGDGRLERGPGEPLRDRTELGRKASAPREVARIGQLTDTHVRDEESPARVPFLDRLGPPVTSTFRPQEAVSAQVLNAAVRSLDAERPDEVLVTGDLLDNAQRNELDQLLAVLRGGRVDPDSGARGYRGVQSAGNPDGFFYRPAVDAPRHRGVLRRAQRSFVAPGLRAPFALALGNHDLMVQGELPPSSATDAIATGDEALLTFDPGLRDLLDQLPRGADPTPDLRDVPRPAIEALLSSGVPGRATRVPPDPRRRAVRAGEIGPAHRSLDVGPVRVIVLDTVDRDGGAGGVVTETETRFLRDQLAKAADDAWILVADHHGLERSANSAEALALLDADPRVVAEISGDTHRHEIRPRFTAIGGWWQITTSSLADWPQQGRMLRFVEGAGGARAIETWVVDHAGAPEDPEDLAGFGREMAYLDAQGGRPQRFAGTREDRNVRLWLPNRWGMS
jgi:hypothetical protein